MVDSTKKLIGQAKRMWTQSKLERVYTDEIAADEMDIINQDEKLALMVQQRKEIEKRIIQRIDDQLKAHREAKAAKLEELEKQLEDSIVPDQSHLGITAPAQGGEYKHIHTAIQAQDPHKHIAKQAPLRAEREE